MCGRFTQYNSREEYLAFLGEEAERSAPAGRARQRHCLNRL